MDSGQFQGIYDKIREKKDIPELAAQTGLQEDALNNILVQKTIRQTMRKHHVIVKKARELAKRWAAGESFMNLSREYEFSPVMMASLILMENGTSRKDFRRMLKEPATIFKNRLKDEILDILEHDLVYSPEENLRQAERGKFVEARVGHWLDERGITYITEKQAKKLHKKTPDFLLNEKLNFHGSKVKWIECKASFGDTFEIKRDYKKQVRHYLEMFGHGAIVYWYGHVSDHGFTDYMIVSANVFKP